MTYNSTTQLAKQTPIHRQCLREEQGVQRTYETWFTVFLKRFTWFLVLLCASGNLFSVQEQKRESGTSTCSVRFDGRSRTPPTDTGHKQGLPCETPGLNTVFLANKPVASFSSSAVLCRQTLVRNSQSSLHVPFSFLKL